ncbi:MAG: hypothetical protein Q7R54_00510 [bacterium]|nr:hypothetical protein [bacterium]
MATSNILSALHLELLTPREQEEILLTLGDIVFRGTLVRLIERMDEKTRDDFAALLAANASPEKVEEFLKKRVPGGESSAAETLSDLASDLRAVGV